VPGALVVVLGYSLLCGVSMDRRGILYFACFLIVPGIYVSIDENSSRRMDANETS
jgi:hypothetical protein